MHTDKINASAVTDVKLNNNAVTTNKINNLAVTQGKLAAEAVSEAKLHVGNAPTNDYVLTAASGQPGGLIWSSPAIVSGWNTVIEQTNPNNSRIKILILFILSNETLATLLYHSIQTMHNLSHLCLYL